MIDIAALTEHDVGKWVTYSGAKIRHPPFSKQVVLSKSLDTNPRLVEPKSGAAADGRCRTRLDGLVFPVR